MIIIKLFSILNMNANDIRLFAELSDKALEFINYVKSHVESFEEIKRLLFTKEKYKIQYSMIEMIKIIFLFQKTKISAISKILDEKPLTFMERLLIERLIMNFTNSEYISVEEHLNRINKT